MQGNNYNNPNYEQQAYKPAERPRTTAITEKNITDSVGNAIAVMQEDGRLILPRNYSVGNALKSAYLVLSNKGMLNNPNKDSLMKALLDMCVQGLNPSKNQCYFIDYGGNITLMRSYHGDRAVCLMSGLISDLQAYVIRKGDEVDMGYDENGYLYVKVKTKFDNIGNDIIGAYAFAIRKSDGQKVYDVMNIDRIKKSWSMSKNNGNGNKLQNNFTDDACLRTITRHLVKMIFNQSTDDNLMVDTYCETTANEYDNNKDRNVVDGNVTEVNETQRNENASIDPPTQPAEGQPSGLASKYGNI